MSCGRCIPPWLDCSDEAQDERKRQLAELMAKRRSGVRSVADRGRSVSYGSPDELKAIIAQLQNEIGLCAGWRRPPRLGYVDQNKGL